MTEEKKINPRFRLSDARREKMVGLVNEPSLGQLIAAMEQSGVGFDLVAMALRVDKAVLDRACMGKLAAIGELDMARVDRITQVCQAAIDLGVLPTKDADKIEPCFILAAELTKLREWYARYQRETAPQPVAQQPEGTTESE